LTWTARGRSGQLIDTIQDISEGISQGTAKERKQKNYNFSAPHLAFLVDVFIDSDCAIDKVIFTKQGCLSFPNNAMQSSDSFRIGNYDGF
jgi:hypothetical protein